MASTRLCLLSLAAFVLSTCGDYYPDIGQSLDKWTKKQVSHWLVYMDFYQAVPAFYKAEIDGTALQNIKKADLRVLGIENANTQRRLLKDIKALKEQVTEAQAAIVTDNYHYHECQVDPVECDRTWTFVDLVQLFFPRLSMLFNGLHGSSLSSIPFKYRLLWLINPHSAVLHSGLETFGMNFFPVTIGRHIINAVASWTGLLLECILVNVAYVYFVSGEFERSALTKIISSIGHLIGLLTLPLDWLVGWYIPWLRVLLTLRDAFVLYNMWQELAKWSDRVAKEKGET